MDDAMRAGVLSAMRDEAFTFAEYMLYAEQARSEGRDDIAALFTGAANVELHEHFAGLAAAYGLCGTSEENLEAAIRDESAAGRQGYSALAARARAAGERSLADRCTAYEREENAHRRSFEQALEDLEVPH